MVIIHISFLKALINYVKKNKTKQTKHTHTHPHTPHTPTPHTPTHPHTHTPTHPPHKTKPKKKKNQLIDHE